MSPASRKITLGPAGTQISESVRRLREKDKLTYVELSKRLTEIGRPIPVLGLRRIEAGERRVDVDDLEALAHALGVPPVQLVFPVGSVDEVEVPPGLVVPTATALRWFTGEGGPAMSSDEVDSRGRGERDPETGLYEWYEGMTDWEDKAAPVRLLREHISYVRDWYAAPVEVRRQTARAREDEGAAGVRLAVLRERVEEGLRTVREEMRRRGLTAPELPEELGDIDEFASSREARRIIRDL